MSHTLRTLAGTPWQRDIHSTDFLLVGQLRADLDEGRSWSSLLRTLIFRALLCLSFPSLPQLRKQSPC